MKGHTYWFTGLSGSGKTTIANTISEIFRNNNIPIVILDGDVVRKTLSSDLGYTKEERDKHIKRIADVCKIITDNGIINIACVISPTKKMRDYARNNISRFSEIYIKCSLKKCIKRDVKGYYKKFNEGKIKNVVGMDIVYEEPENPDLILNTDKHDLDYCFHKFLDYIIEVEKR